MKFNTTLKYSSLFIIVPAMAVMACGGSAPEDPNTLIRTPRPTATPRIDVELEVFNETEASLCYLLIAPSDEDFDEEYLDGVEIAPGESYTVSGLYVGEYNVKVHN